MKGLPLPDEEGPSQISYDSWLKCQFNNDRHFRRRGDRRSILPMPSPERTPPFTKYDNHDADTDGVLPMKKSSKGSVNSGELELDFRHENPN